MPITINGSGTVTGISTGGLPDNTVDGDTISSNSVNNAKLADDAVDSAEIADGAVDLAHLSASGTKNNTVFLRGDNTWNAPAGGASSGRNVLLNGDMMIAQDANEDSLASQTPSGSANEFLYIDRWISKQSNGGAFTVTQSTDVPADQGFVYSMKWDCTTANTVMSSNERIRLTQNLESQQLHRFLKGSSNAKVMALSFWVKSNLTGIITCQLIDEDNSGRTISKTVTINSANTWEKKTCLFAGDTTNAPFDKNNGWGLQVVLHFKAGANYTDGTYTDNTWAALVSGNQVHSSNINLASSTSNELYITGLQLEPEEVTDYEFLDMGLQLAKCQRYYHVINQKGGTATSRSVTSAVAAYSATEAYATFQHPVPMRSDPSVVSTNGTSNWQILGSFGGSAGGDNFPNIVVSPNDPQGNNATNCWLGPNADLAITAGNSYWVRTNDGDASLAFRADPGN